MPILIKFLYMLAASAMLATGGFAYMSNDHRMPSPAFDTQAVTRGAVRKLVSASGQVRARVTVQVSSQLSGLITELPADFNSEVKAGDLLARLDDKTYRAREDAALADLAMANAELAIQRAAMDKAVAVLRQADRSIGRRRELAKRGVTSGADLDLAVRDAEVSQAEINLIMAQITRANANIRQKRAGLKQAQLDLERTEIRAPIDGTVIVRSIELGQTVAASLQAPELFKIVPDLRRIRIEAHVSEADIGSIVPGNPVAFAVDAHPDRQFVGTVTQVRLAGTEQNNIVTYAVMIESDNADRALLPGMTANAQIETARRELVLRIPSDAISFKPRGIAGDQGEEWQAKLGDLRHRLGLDGEQTDKLRYALRAASVEVATRVISRSAAAASASGSDDEIELRGDGRFAEVVAGVITGEQLPAFQAWVEERAAERTAPGPRATVWKLTTNNTLSRRVVRIGVSDDQFTEVFGGGLVEGDRIVVRMRKPRTP